MNIDELKNNVGTRLLPGKWFSMSQERINQFADVTGDYQFIHVDPLRAASTPLGGTISHGLLTLSLLPMLVEGWMPVPDNTKMGINYGFDKVRFLNPVRPSDRVRAVATLADVQKKSSDSCVIKLNVEIEIEGLDKPALVCEWLNMFVCE